MKSNWRTAGGLLGLILLCGALVWAMAPPEGQKQALRPERKVMPREYYSLMFHLQQLGPAVYQAAGDGIDCPKKGCRPDWQQLQKWLIETKQLVDGLEQDPALSNRCQDLISPVQKRIQIYKGSAKQKQSNQKAYQVGYSAWKDISRLLAVCSGKS